MNFTERKPRELSFELPLIPISLNRMWRNFNGRTIVSQEGRSFKKDVGIMLNAQRLAQSFDGYDGLGIKVEAHFFAKKFYTVKGKISDTGGDVDNLWKVLGDTIFDQIGINDSHVLKLELNKHRGIEEKTIVVLSFGCV